MLESRVKKIRMSLFLRPLSAPAGEGTLQPDDLKNSNSTMSAKTTIARSGMSASASIMLTDYIGAAIPRVRE